MGNSPTALNKRGNKVHCSDGYTFDSEKEHRFYHGFIRDCGFEFKVHPQYILQPLLPLDEPAKMSQVAYTPDFVVFDEYHAMLHVYDVKNSFGPYGIDTGNKLRFKWFTATFGIPVEAVVVRAHDFRVAAIGVTKQLNLDGKGKAPAPITRTDVNYSWHEATNY